MNLRELLERLIWQENELYNLHKLGETFAAYERPDMVEDFQLMAEEKLRHRKTLESMLARESLGGTAVLNYMDSLSLEPMLRDSRSEPASLEELIMDAVIREKHAYELYGRLASILDGTLSQLFQMMADEELKHAYRLRLLYEGL